MLLVPYFLYVNVANINDIKKNTPIVLTIHQIAPPVVFALSSNMVSISSSTHPSFLLLERDILWRVFGDVVLLLDDLFESHWTGNDATISKQAVALLAFAAELLH